MILFKYLLKVLIFKIFIKKLLKSPQRASCSAAGAHSKQCIELSDCTFIPKLL